MYVCRLFHKDHPSEQVDARFLASGRISIGRDAGADWTLDDPDSTLSRLHCVLEVAEGRLLLHDKSTNGTWLAADARAPADRPVELAVKDSFRLGVHSIVIDHASELAGADPLATTINLPLALPATPVPVDWSDAAPRPTHARREASLLEAFCEGARLDASALSSEDPAELMRRLGAIYQATVLGLGTLMADRTRVKGEYRLERTTIAAADNNPFKWAPSRKLAQALLCGDSNGFLNGAAAVRASFQDLGRHASAVVEGANAASALAVERLAPAAIEEEAKGQTSLLKGRAAACWEVHARRHADLTSEGGDALRRAFGRGYMDALDRAEGSPVS